jgi:hypothetical protein
MALIEDIKTVHYATKDPIQNLKIRVTLTRLSVQRALAKVQVSDEDSTCHAASIVAGLCHADS